MTVSSGVATFPLDAQDDIALVKVADSRLYQAKEKGRNCTRRTGGRAEVSRALAAALLASAVAALPLGAGEIPGAVLVLETAPGTPGSDPSGAPPRFVLLKDGQVFVGGSSLLETGRLEKGEAQALQKRASALRKIPGIGSPISFGGVGRSRLRLRLLEDEPLEIVATGCRPSGPNLAAGDPAAHRRAGPARPARGAAPGARALSPPEPAAVRAILLFPDRPRGAARRAGAAPGRFPFPIAEALAAPRAVAAAEAAGLAHGRDAGVGLRGRPPLRRDAAARCCPTSAPDRGPRKSRAVPPTIVTVAKPSQPWRRRGQTRPIFEAAEGDMRMKPRCSWP